MHPILARPARLGAYLAAWGPLAAILAGLLGLSGSVTWTEAAVLAVPLCLVYAFVCLSSWYVCKALPLNVTSPGRLAATFLLAAAVAASLWVVMANTLASFLAVFPPFTSLPERLSRGAFVVLILGILLYLLVVFFHYVLMALEAAGEHERLEAELRNLAQAAELKLLKEQLNPHFLFNALNSISALSSSDPGGAREMCVRLGEFYRRTLGVGERTSIALREELALAHDYLAVEQVRFGDRLQVVEEVDAAVNECPVPPLLLQPLVENAVKHGIARLTQGGTLRLSTRREEGGVRIAVENPVDPDDKPTEGHGMGLHNVEKRIRARYGAGATMKRTLSDGLFSVVISLPV